MRRAGEKSTIERTFGGIGGSAIGDFRFAGGDEQPKEERTRWEPKKAFELARTPCGVGATGFEPATPWSQTRCATNCATPRGI